MTQHLTSFAEYEANPRGLGLTNLRRYPKSISVIGGTGLIAPTF